MKVILSVLLMSLFLSQAQASGCDYSCWSYSDRIVAQNRYSLDFFKLAAATDSTSVVLIQKPKYAEPRMPDSIVFSGYERQRPLHPGLVSRLLKPEEIRSGIVTQADVELSVTAYDGGVTVVKTGQYRLEVHFETGESVTLYYPSFRDLIESEDGTIHQDNLLPLFFK